MVEPYSASTMIRNNLLKVFLSENLSEIDELLTTLNKKEPDDILGIAIAAKELANSIQNGLNFMQIDILSSILFDSLALCNDYAASVWSQSDDEDLYKTAGKEFLTYLKEISIESTEMLFEAMYLARMISSFKNEDAMKYKVTEFFTKWRPEELEEDEEEEISTELLPAVAGASNNYQKYGNVKK